MPPTLKDMLVEQRNECLLKNVETASHPASVEITDFLGDLHP
jgi:hypothetical protein